MTEHLLFHANRLVLERAVEVEVRFVGGDKKRMKKWLGPLYSYHFQSGEDLGVRMATAFKDTFQSEVESVILAGTDIPELSAKMLENAFSKLKTIPMILGPSNDGGYYLIGLRRDINDKTRDALFEGVDWGGQRVLEQTKRNARKQKVDYQLLDELNDVDLPEDLIFWEKVQENSVKKTERESISVIIPTLNEESNIRDTLNSVKSDHVREIILVDGRSIDNTVSIAKSEGVRCLSSRPSRAQQMNKGACHATGDIFIFLHGDTRLPKDYTRHIRRAVRKPDTVGGAFSLAIDSPVKMFRVVECFANWRSRLLKMPYGDQAFFVHSTTFFKAGGFPDQPIMEDAEFIRRLNRKGSISILSQRVKTSARRWLNRGILKTFLINQLVILAYVAGVSVDVIKQFYNRPKGVE